MVSNPSASVIVACFNQGRFLEEALQSIHAQQWPGLEIIVVDDGSTDPETLAALERLLPLTTQIIRTSNQGVVAARNTGVNAATGTYILPLDADDKLGPHYLAQAIALLEADPDLGIVYCKADFFGERTGPWELPAYRFPDILKGNVIFNSSVYRRTDWESAGGYNPNMQGCGWEDFDLWLGIIALGRTVHQIQETLFYYRIVNNSRNAAMTQEASKYVQAHLTIFHNHQALYLQHMDVVFGELIRLWGVVEEKDQRISSLEHQLQTTNTASPPLPETASRKGKLRRFWHKLVSSDPNS